MPATLHCSHPETGRPQTKCLTVSNLQDSQDRKPTETPTDGVLCTLVLARKLRLGLGQQLNSSLEADLVVDMVSHLNKVGGNYFVLNKLVAREKKSCH
jgi:hypothetical protein